MNSLFSSILKIGEKQAKLLNINLVDTHSLKKTLDCIFYERSGLIGYKSGIITKDEFAHLILVHYQSSICHSVGSAEPGKCPDYQDLHNELIVLLEMEQSN